MAEVVVPAIASDGRVTDPEANDELGARAAVDSGSEEDLLTDSKPGCSLDLLVASLLT